MTNRIRLILRIIVLTMIAPYLIGSGIAQAESPREALVEMGDQSLLIAKDVEAISLPDAGPIGAPDKFRTSPAAPLTLKEIASLEVSESEVAERLKVGAGDDDRCDRKWNEHLQKYEERTCPTLKRTIVGNIVGLALLGGLFGSLSDKALDGALTGAAVAIVVAGYFGFLHYLDH